MSRHDNMDPADMFLERVEAARLGGNLIACSARDFSGGDYISARYPKESGLTEDVRNRIGEITATIYDDRQAMEISFEGCDLQQMQMQMQMRMRAGLCMGGAQL